MGLVLSSKVSIRINIANRSSIRQFHQGCIDNLTESVLNSKVSRKHSSRLNHYSSRSIEEDVKEHSDGPVSDAGITYSFDVPHGPSEGSSILSMAINQAVERFEIKVTEKLVKDEYEVITPEIDHGQTDEGFELVEAL